MIQASSWVAFSLQGNLAMADRDAAVRWTCEHCSGFAREDDRKWSTMFNVRGDIVLRLSRAAELRLFVGSIFDQVPGFESSQFQPHPGARPLPQSIINFSGTRSYFAGVGFEARL
jgi:hypothetical protein